MTLYSARMLVLVLFLSFLAQFKVKSNFRKYSKVAGKNGGTGVVVARQMLDCSCGKTNA